MASTADLIKGGIQQAAAGKELNSNTISDVDPNSIGDSQATEGYEQEVRAENSTDGDLLPGSDSDQETQEDSLDADLKTAAQSKGKQANPETSAKEVITVTDAQGKRRKVEIDYSDRNAIRKAFELGAGARKWQAERDQAIQKYKQVEPQLSKLNEVQGRWDTLESAYASGGVEGVVDMLEGRKGAFADAAKKRYERERFLEEASPAEIKALQDREDNERQRFENDKLRQENEKFKQEVTQEREQTEIKALESRIHPTFDKYRFAGKLGDPTDEHMFDEMLWTTAMKRLEPYEEQGLDITPELVDKEFRSVSMAIRKRVGIQAVKTAAKVVEQKKQEATENVQAKLKSGYKAGGVEKEARDLINNGNLSGLLKNWGKYGGLFNK